MEENIKYKSEWILEKWLDKESWESGKDPDSISEIAGNCLLTEGINELFTILCSAASGTKFDSTHCYIGVGSDATAATAAQTGLIANSNKSYMPMDSGFPTYGTNGMATFKATWGSDDANYSWNEFSIANGNSDSAKNLNRKVSAQSTKVQGQIWSMTFQITLS